VKSLAGRAAVDTGATRGIGRAIALELARRGADVAFNYAQSAEAAEGLRAEIEARGVRTLAARCDVANTEAAAEMVKQVKAEFGRVDFLVNNAGIARDNLSLRMKEEKEDWDAVIDTSLKGVWNFSRAVLRQTLKNDGGGSILNTSFISGILGTAEHQEGSEPRLQNNCGIIFGVANERSTAWASSQTRQRGAVNGRDGDGL
jgi:3-oxoacyl-[acyl-carrier protein] reductase